VGLEEAPGVEVARARGEGSPGRAGERLEHPLPS
jgi:hypothetical protein